MRSSFYLLFIFCFTSTMLLRTANAAEMGGQLKLKQEQPKQEQALPVEKKVPEDEGPGLEETMAWLKGKLDKLVFTITSASDNPQNISYDYDYNGCSIKYTLTHDAKAEADYSKYYITRIWEVNLTNSEIYLPNEPQPAVKYRNADRDIWLVSFTFADLPVTETYDSKDIGAANYRYSPPSIKQKQQLTLFGSSYDTMKRII